MLHNYHTHTPRCGHASGTGTEYVRAAIDAGFSLLGFSDHAPYRDHPRDYISIRMSPELLPDYAAEFFELKARFGEQIELHLGVEAEFYPSYFEGLLSELRAAGVEYLILGQHFLDDGLTGLYSGRATGDPAMLDRYVGQCLDALSTGYFTYFAHPDLLYFTGSDEEYARQMRRLCRGAKDLGVPLELNLLGLREGRNYPDPRFWRIAAEEGCPAVIGWDAHKPEALNVPEVFSRARAALDALGVERLESVPLRPIG